MNTSRITNKKGFTLIELLLYLAIASVLITILSGASIDMLRISKKTQNLQEVQYTSSFIYSTLDRVASGAYAITNPVGVATSSSVTFRMYEAELDPTVLSLVDGVMHLQEGATSPIPLHASNIQSRVTYTNISPEEGYDSIRVQLGVSLDTQSVLTSAQAGMDLETTITLQYSP